MFHKTFRNAELGSGSPTQSLVCCRSDAAQSVWTFIAHSFLLTRLICIFASRNVPRFTSEWEPIYFMALLYFPWDSYVCTRRQNETTYLSLLTSSWAGDLKICKRIQYHIIITLWFLKIFVKPSTVTGMCTRAGNARNWQCCHYALALLYQANLRAQPLTAP